jgi:putative ABC transport system substrate-binding protein
MIRRREFVSLLTGAAAGWPLLAHAQSTNRPVIGFLNPGSPRVFAPFLAAFHKGLNAAGYVEGRNVSLEVRWAEGDFNRLREQATDLVSRRVSLIVATGGTASANAAKRATDTIPVLFVGGADPVEAGLVSSLNRPGGNATGVSVYTSALVRKRLELLQELVPKATVVALLVNPNGVVAKIETKDLREAADLIGLKLLALEAANEGDFEAAFASAAAQQAGALLVSADPFFTSRHVRLIELAARHRLPAGYPLREYVVAGGLMSYGPSIVDAYRQIGDYAGRILKGAKPSDLPVQLPTTFDMALNLQTAKALAIEVPYPLLVTANEVIE